MKRPLESKKFILATIAFAFGAFVYLSTFVGMLCRPDVATHLGSLAMTAYGLITLVAGAGITGQAFIDLRNQTNVDVSAQVESRREEIIYREELERGD